ncbi:MAG TPA: hypothetical protein VLG50_01550 [Candidatus Saccharimonadales bacterium]|nr:hypothetical protein [Candidatus Saccharimonadales bacterium]
MFFKKNWFMLSSFLIAFLAAVIRFYNFSNRWVLAGDQAHFALVGKYMLESKLLPLLGPFSSAGPFQTGGEWYWFVAIGSIFSFFGVTAPWIFLVATYIFFVYLMIVIGQKMEGKKFGLVVGCLSAVSTGEIIQSVNLSNQSPIPLFSALSILCMILYLQTKSSRFIFLMSFLVGIAISIHLQGVALIALILITIILGYFPGIKRLILIPIGLVIPWVPVFIADSQNHFANSYNMIYYFFFEKNKASFDELGRRWLTFVGVFIPYAWGYTIGGVSLMGYLMTPIVFGFGVYQTIKKQITRQWIVLFVSTILMFIILRYTRTPLFESFYAFLHPFTLLLTGWGLLQVYKRKKLIAITIFICLIATSLYFDISEITKIKFNINTVKPQKEVEKLVEKFPSKKFAIYDYKFDTSGYSQSLSLYLYNADKIDDNGMKIGFSNTDTLEYPIVLRDGGFILYDISSLSPEKLTKQKWVFVNPSGIYHSGQDWYKKK